MTPVILVARQLPEAMMSALAQFGEVQVLRPEADLPEHAVALVAVAVDPVPRALIQRFPPQLRLIANIGVGTDNIDLMAAAEHGVRVSNTPVVTEDTADLTMALLLATCRRLGQAERRLRAGDFQAGASQLGIRVHGKTLGIVGFGAIGQAVARRARGFGMSIIYNGPNPKPEAGAALDARYCDSLQELLGAADIVSLNCGLTAATRHLINAQSLGWFKPGSVLINTGRGAVIDEAALVEALREGRLAAAGLDVFEFEPAVTPALLELDSVTVLPHIGSATAECRTDMVMRVLANLRQFLTDGQVLDPVVAH